uniref:Uncharacterized protein n=1 Tax=Oryza brachyantha TaxID=4533 RepID=J3LPT4_ORYBR
MLFKICMSCAYVIQNIQDMHVLCTRQRGIGPRVRLSPISMKLYRPNRIPAYSFSFNISILSIIYNCTTSFFIWLYL